MICFPDVNVWIALVSDQHVHNRVAKKWVESVPDDRLAFCRLTELGLLRLLTNRSVMGADVMDCARAWIVYQALRGDPRISFLTEQPGFDELWQQSAGRIEGGPNAWTDAYLAVFGSHVRAAIITFDRGFKRFAACEVITLFA